MSAVTTSSKRRAADFAAEWNALDKADRKRIRRLVRIGRPVDTSDEARLAVRYAAFQRSRIWMKLFWVWFVPATLLCLAAATRIHPVVIGIVAASALSAVNTRRNYGRVAKVNATLL